MVRALKDVRLPWKRDQLLNVFKSYDRDGDGKLSKDEVKQAFKYLGSRCSFYRATKAFRKVDFNKNGLIDLVELSDLVDYALDCGYEVA